MNTPSPCDKCNHLYWDPMYEEDPTYEAECKKHLPMGKECCSEFEDKETEIVLFKDLPDSDHSGKTIGEVNLKKKHNITEGSLVEIKKTGVRLFVVLCGMDCDGTPLYWLSPELRDYKVSRKGLCLKWVGSYSEEALEVIKRGEEK